MSLFQRATNLQAFLKCGISGFAGAGKTHTASRLAIGLVLYLRACKLKEGPVHFLDSETGADWVAPLFAEHGIELLIARSRAFGDLVPAVDEAERSGGLLIIDSITHHWRELCESYKRKKKRKRLQFQDWDYLKGADGWGGFNERFINSQTPHNHVRPGRLRI